jgi:hypothetical protein
VKPQRTPPVFYAGGVTVDDILECGLVQQVYEDAYNAALPKTYDGTINLHNKAVRDKRFCGKCCRYRTIKMIVKANLAHYGSGWADDPS